MPHSVLVGYASRYGSTREVAEAVAETLRGTGCEVKFQALGEVRSLEGFSAVVMGAPLFMFRWHKDALRFLSRFQKILKEMPVAVFALGPTHDPSDEKVWTDARAQLDKALAKFPWFEPRAIEIFGGKYDPDKLDFPLKMFAGKVPASDIRDWEAIKTWANSLPTNLHTTFIPRILTPHATCGKLAMRRNPDHSTHKDALLVNIQGPSLAASDLNALGIGNCAWAEPILQGSALFYVTDGTLSKTQKADTQT